MTILWQRTYRVIGTYVLHSVTCLIGIEKIACLLYLIVVEPETRPWTHDLTALNEALIQGQCDVRPQRRETNGADVVAVDRSQNSELM